MSGGRGGGGKQPERFQLPSITESRPPDFAYLSTNSRVTAPPSSVLAARVGGGEFLGIAAQCGGYKALEMQLVRN